MNPPQRRTGDAHPRLDDLDDLDDGGEWSPPPVDDGGPSGNGSYVHRDDGAGDGMAAWSPPPEVSSDYAEWTSASLDERSGRRQWDQPADAPPPAAAPVAWETAPPTPPPGPGQVFVPAPEQLSPAGSEPGSVPLGPPEAMAPLAPPVPDLGAAPLGPPGPPVPPMSLDMRPFRPPPERPAPRPRRRGIDRRRLAVVYDIEGPRVRLGVGWFLLALAATVISPVTAALVYAAAAGLAARQVARAWGTVSWQADLAAGLGAVPVLAALGGTKLMVAALGAAAAVALGAACAPDGARLRGPGGRVATVGILWLAIVPSAGVGCFVLVCRASVIAGVVLLLVASAYEAGDYIVGSGASNKLEGPLAGITTATLVALPLAQLLVEPFDEAGVALLGFSAVAYPLGQIMASAILPGAGAPAPALRRIDTLLLLAPLWAAAAGAF